MKRMFIIARRVLTQLRHDHRFLAVSIMAPLVIIYFFKLFFDTMPNGVVIARYIVPLAAFIVHFLAFLLCALVLVQERTAGTLERMLVNGFTRMQIIGGYALGYTLLATFQAVIALTEVIWLFDLSYTWGELAGLFGIMWLLALTSVMLGMFISTFAHREAQVIPFIPLILLPSIFLSGLLVDVDKLPEWVSWISRIFPLYYANQVIQYIIDIDTSNNIWLATSLLIAYGFGLLLLASQTLREAE